MPAALSVAALAVVLNPAAALVMALAVAAAAVWSTAPRTSVPGQDETAAPPQLDIVAGQEEAAPPRLDIATRLVLWSVRLFVIAASLAAHNLTLSLLALAVVALSTLPSLLAPVDGDHGAWRVPLLALALSSLSVLIWVQDVPSRYLILRVLVLMIIAVAAARLCRARGLIALAALDAVGIYLLASTVGYFLLGMRSTARYVESPAALLGLFDERITFPFASGPTAPAAMAAAYLAGYLALARQGIMDGRRLRLLCLASAVIVVVAANGRVALLTTASVGLLAYFSPRLLARTAVPVMLVMLFLPLWWPVIDSVAGPGGARWVAGKPLLDRGEGRKQVESLSGRTKIWDRFYDGYGDLPLARKVFGYGARGQVKSGVSRSYAHMFVQYEDPRGITPHSTVLQQALDGGVVGVTLLIVVLTASARRLAGPVRRSARSRAPEPAAACLAMLVVFAATAATEASLAPGQHQEQFWATLVIVAVASVYHDRLRNQPASQRSPAA